MLCVQNTPKVTYIAQSRFISLQGKTASCSEESLILISVEISKWLCGMWKSLKFATHEWEGEAFKGTSDTYIVDCMYLLDYNWTGTVTVVHSHTHQAFLNCHT